MGLMCGNGLLQGAGVGLVGVAIGASIAHNELFRAP